MRGQAAPGHQDLEPARSGPPAGSPVAAVAPAVLRRKRPNRTSRSESKKCGSKCRLLIIIGIIGAWWRHPVDAARIIQRVAGRSAETFAFRRTPGMQRPAYGWKSDVTPGNFIPGKQPDVFALRPRGKGRRPGIGETGAEDDLDLPDPGNAEHTQDAVDHDGRFGLFQGFARRPFLQRFAKFHISCRQGPETLARLDGPPAHQNASAGCDHRADNHLRILVGDVAAVGADRALTVIAFRNAPEKGGHTIERDASESEDPAGSH